MRLQAEKSCAGYRLFPGSGLRFIPQYQVFTDERIHMQSKRLILKLGMLALSLVTLYVAARPASATRCRTFAVFCTTDTSGGHCGYQPGEDCNTCYGIDGSVKSSTSCPAIR